MHKNHLHASKLLIKPTRAQGSNGCGRVKGGGGRGVEVRGLWGGGVSGRVQEETRAARVNHWKMVGHCSIPPRGGGGGLIVDIVLAIDFLSPPSLISLTLCFTLFLSLSLHLTLLIAFCKNLF